MKMPKPYLFTTVATITSSFSSLYLYHDCKRHKVIQSLYKAVWWYDKLILGYANPKIFSVLNYYRYKTFTV